MDNYTVYVHISPSCKRYVGITSLSCFEKWKSGLGYRTQPYFWRAIQKYGWKNIEHYILFDSVNLSFAKEKEKELIRLWDTTNPKYGYNSTNGGDCCTYFGNTKIDMYDRNGNLINSFNDIRSARKYLLERYNLDVKYFSIISSCKGHTLIIGNQFVFRYGGETFDKYRVNYKEKGLEVVQYNKNGEIIKEFLSIAEAEKKTGIQSSSISAVCSGKRYNAGGFIWRYKEDNFDKFPIEQPNKCILQYDWYGNLLKKWKNSKELKEFFNKDLIMNCCCGFSPSSQGFVWRYEGDSFDKYNYEYIKNYEVCQFDLDGNLLHIYKNTAEAKYNTHIEHITTCCQNKDGRKQAGGFIWKFKQNCTQEELDKYYSSNL